LYDEENLYFGITCSEPLMNQLSDAPLEPNGPVSERDCVEIFLDPEGKGFAYYQFMASAGNSQRSSYFIEGGSTTIGDYGSRWESAIYKGKDFWSAEVKIPLCSLYQTASSRFSDVWGMNVARERKPGGAELLTWSPTKLRGFHDPTAFNKVRGLPGKSARFDLEFDSLTANPRQADGENWKGNMTIGLVATPLTAGNYRASLRLDGKEVLKSRPITLVPGKNQVVLDEVVYTKLGKNLAELIIENDRNEICGVCVLPVRVEFAPFQITFQEPFYGNCFFPGQKADEVKGSVQLNIPPNLLPKAVAKISLQGPGLAVEPVTTPIKNGQADFCFPVTGMQVGEFQLQCDVLVEGKTVAQQTCLIRKLAQPFKGNAVWLDRNLNLIVNGQPRFVRGWYGAGGWMVSTELLKQPQDLLSKNVNSWGLSSDVTAERTGVVGVKEQVKKDVEPSPAVYEVMKKNIEQHRGDPNLLVWYLADEPECRGLSPVYLRHQYEFVKKLDPFHPVMIISRSPELFTQCADVISPHPYINPRVDDAGKRSLSNPMRASGQQIKTVLQSGKGRIAPWLTPQAFSYGTMSDRFGDFPTFTEYRASVYAAVVNGCKGIFPFMYCEHFNSLDLRMGCDFVYETLAKMDEFLLGPEKPLPISVKAPNDAVEVMLKSVDGKLLLIAVNTEDQDLDATLESPLLQDTKKLWGYRENGEVDLQQGKFKLHFTPYQVHLLSNPVLDQGLKKVETFMSELAAAKAELRKPGNLLYGRGKEIEWGVSESYMSSNPMGMFTLTDGICDSLGFVARVQEKSPAWVEMRFRTFVPKFKSAKIYSATIEDLDFLIWKDGAWQKAGEVRGNQEPVIEFKFDRQLSTVKIKLLLTKVHAGKKAEIYEVELYD
jgi:hypothetical protein